MSDIERIEMFALFLDENNGNGKDAAQKRGWLSSERLVSPLGKQLLESLDDQFGTHASYRHF